MTEKILKTPKMAWLRNGMQTLLVKGPDFRGSLTSFEYETYELQLKTQALSTPIQLLSTPGT